MSLLNTFVEREIKPGFYRTTIQYFKEIIPEKSDRQPYIKVQMDIDGIEVTDRWYANRIPYIMRCLRHQFHADYLDFTLSQLLKYCSKHTFTVKVTYDGYYGRQLDYIEE
jgi:hypothetical protein